RRWRRRRRRWRVEEAAGRTAGDTADHAGLDADVLDHDRFGLDFCRRFNGSGVRIDFGDSSLLLLLRRWRRWRRRWRRWRCRDEGCHPARRWHGSDRHQGNDDDGAQDHRVNDDRERERVPFLRPDPDRRVDDIAEHFSWHGGVLLRLSGKPNATGPHTTVRPRGRIIVSTKTVCQRRVRAYGRKILTKP